MLQSTVVDALQGGREESWRIYFNDNVNPNDDKTFGVSSFKFHDSGILGQATHKVTLLLNS